VLAAAVLLLTPCADSAAARTVYVIANSSTPVSELSREDIEKIYLLRQQFWPDGKAVVPVNRDAASDLRAFFPTSF